MEIEDRYCGNCKHSRTNQKIGSCGASKVAAGLPYAGCFRDFGFPHWQPVELPVEPQASTKGQKFDSSKPDMAMLRHLKNALQAVVGVMSAGAMKYEEAGFLDVPNGERRYASAQLRHWLEDPEAAVEDMQEYADKLGVAITHDMCEACNALFKLELRLRRKQEEQECRE